MTVRNRGLNVLDVATSGQQSTGGDDIRCLKFQEAVQGLRVIPGATVAMSLTAGAEPITQVGATRRILLSLSQHLPSHRHPPREGISNSTQGAACMGATLRTSAEWVQWQLCLETLSQCLSALAGGARPRPALRRPAPRLRFLGQA